MKLAVCITTDKVLWERRKLCFEEVKPHHGVKNVLVYIRQLVMHPEGCHVIKHCHLAWYLRTVKLSIKTFVEVERNSNSKETHTHTKLSLSLSGIDKVIKYLSIQLQNSRQHQTNALHSNIKVFTITALTL
jgi:hypothetical protein